MSLSDKTAHTAALGLLTSFCLILRISPVWKTNSSVMESSLMKALSFAGFRWGLEKLWK